MAEYVFYAYLAVSVVHWAYIKKSGKRIENISVALNRDAIKTLSILANTVSVFGRRVNQLEEIVKNLEERIGENGA